MKRDLELIRKILLTIESYEDGLFRGPLTIHGYCQDEVDYHATLILDAGLAIGTDTTPAVARSPRATLQRLNGKGHDFLDAARDSARWRQAKAVIEPLGGVPFSVLVKLLTRMAESAVGLDD